MLKFAWVNHLIILLKTLLEKEKMLVTSIFSLCPKCVLPSQGQFYFSDTAILSTAKAFNLGKSKAFVFGKIIIIIMMNLVINLILYVVLQDTCICI